MLGCSLSLILEAELEHFEQRKSLPGWYEVIISFPQKEIIISKILIGKGHGLSIMAALLCTLETEFLVLQFFWKNLSLDPAQLF